ncbi:UxaA family hydrolase [Paenibacillus sp. y28]|uniref:UxaA family hydrolase n=1 Tax=Paenibacillus sp. y28 TaxID=3129110 RepID=UPI00301B1A54
MAGNIEAGAEALVMDGRDHVATAIKDLAEGQQIRYLVGGEAQQLTCLNAVPFGHKIAIAPIQAGDLVLKYGEVIGRATAAIVPGEHVHIHNVEGIRGRGDQAKPEPVKEEKA